LKSCHVEEDFVHFEAPPKHFPTFKSLVAHAATLDMNALTSLLEVAVNEVREKDFSHYDYNPDEAEERWKDFVGALVVEWARAAGFPAAFVGRADLDAAVQVLAAQPNWVKKRVSNGALVWIEEVASNTELVQKICRALKVLPLDEVVREW
jgi:hypothetical protein